MPIDISNNYVRIRVRSPRLFRKGTFRTHDIGRKGIDKRIAGILKRSNKWATQSYLISKNALMRKDKKTLNLLKQIEKKHNLNLSRVLRLI